MIVLPPPVERFLAGKNARDFATAVSGFSASATVIDEAHGRQGTAAIRAWMERTSAEYNDHADVKRVTISGEVAEVVAEVSGTFPGSPVEIRYAFTLKDDRIERLEIR